MTPASRRIAAGRAAVLVAGLLLWTIASRAVAFDLVPSPLAVARRVVDDGRLWEHAATTLAEAGGGLLVGTSLGVGTSVALRGSRRLESALGPVLTTLMGLPKLALAPVATLWFGVGLSSKVAFVAFAVFFIVFFSMQSALRGIDPSLVTTARVLGARRRDVARHVLVPSAMPFLVGALKLVVPHSITVAVVAELIVSRAGLGYYIKGNAAQSDSVGVFTGVTVVMLVVVGLGALLERAERSLNHWRA